MIREAPADHVASSEAAESLARGHVVPSDLADSVVLYPHGARKRVRDFWTDRRCLLVFLRHLACPACSEQVSLLSPHLPELRDAGVRIVLVATSTPERIPAFAKRMHLESAQIDVVTDPTLRTHQSAALVRSLWSTFNPRSVRSSIALWANGHYVTRDPGDGDVLQQGGALLVDAGGAVLFHHANEHVTDHVPMNEVCEIAFLRR
jgi:peroxiredoxin